MAYIPDPTDIMNPTDSVDAFTAAAEFRALKAYIAGLTLGNQNAAIYRKNILHNGCFSVRQRLAISGASAVDAFPADRWKLKRNFSANISGNVGTGFVNLTPKVSDHYLVLGAGAAVTIAAGNYLGVEQALEFLDVSHLMLGLASARTVTFSGAVSAATTGTLPIYFQNAARTRSYVTSINIIAANVWQAFSVTIPLDTTGSWTPALATDAGLIVGFGLANGATYQAPAANTWTAGDYRGLALQVNAFATIGWVNYFHALQLEIGGAATTFEQLPFATKLNLCQRYFERSYNLDLIALPSSTSGLGAYGTATVAGAGTNRLPFNFKIKKRIAPSMIFPTVSRSITASQDGAVPTLLAGSISESGGIVNCAGGSSWAPGHAVMFSYHADADF